MKQKRIGYVVMDVDKFSELGQILGIDCSPELPNGGLLAWSDRPHLFTTKPEARAAIRRTGHYVKSFGSIDFPDSPSLIIETIWAAS